MSKHIVAEPRIVYTSPEGRIVVTRYAADDYQLAVDGANLTSHKTQVEAEHEGAMVLEQEARELAADLADEQAERDEPERCASCGSTAMASPGNGKIYCLACGKRWRAAAGPDYDDEPTDAPGGDSPEIGPYSTDDDILSIDLSLLRACVDSSVTVGALAAIVQSGCYLHRRGLLVDRPEQPDWALVAAVETMIGRAA